MRKDPSGGWASIKSVFIVMMPKTFFRAGSRETERGRMPSWTANLGEACNETKTRRDKQDHPCYRWDWIGEAFLSERARRRRMNIPPLIITPETSSSPSDLTSPFTPQSRGSICITKWPFLALGDESHSARSHRVESRSFE